MSAILPVHHWSKAALALNPQDIEFHPYAAVHLSAASCLSEVAISQCVPKMLLVLSTSGYKFRGVAHCSH
eukprot:scaffold248313_cov23-Tisochrysis_lutea.AAC.1